MNSNSFFSHILLLLLGLICMTTPVHADDAYPSIGIVTMTKKPHRLHTWISYWIDVHNLTHVFLYFDYSPHANAHFLQELETLSPHHHKAIRLINVTTEWRNERWKAHEVDRSTETMRRQSLAIADAIERAKKENVDWLLNLDFDEIVYVRTGESLQTYFSRFTREKDREHLNHTFYFHNWEIVPEHTHYKNCFKEGKVFRMTGTFIAYGNGKGAARVNEHLREYGVHRFLSNVRKWNSSIEFPPEEVVVLHYVCCNAEEFTAKYRILGRFRDDGWDWAQFHREARDKISDCQDSEVRNTTTARPLLAPPSQCELKAAEEMFKKRREFPGELITLDVPI